MADTESTTSDLDVRRRRLLYRAWHRGTLEMDLVMGRFMDSVVAGLNEAELAECERLIQAPDPDLYAWVTGERAVPAGYDTPLFRRWRAFHQG